MYGESILNIIKVLAVSDISLTQVIPVSIRSVITAQKKLVAK